MADVTRTKLPGVGVRHDFDCRTGGRVGVLTHHNGDRELLFYEAGDPDSVRDSVRLGEGESLILAELLGATAVTDNLGTLQQEVEGLVFDWVVVAEDGPAAGTTIGELSVGQRTGASVVAVLRGAKTFPGPGADQRIEAGDTLVLVGSRESVDTAEELLTGA